MFVLIRVLYTIVQIESPGKEKLSDTIKIHSVAMGEFPKLVTLRRLQNLHFKLL